jgi:tetratricopeptide (TPR) repeat protein
VERRLAVLAASNAQALSRRGARGRAWPLALAVLLVAGSADAKPRRRDAKIAFDRGVIAYQKGNFEAAAEALGKSFALERDVDTLFAWAQSERKLDRCDKAIELYEKLLTFNLPAANKTAVEVNLDECRTAVAQQKPRIEPPAVEPRPAEPIAQDPRPAPVEPPRVAQSPVVAAATPEPSLLRDAPPAAVRPWYKDPVALGLGGGGLIAVGVGTGLLISAKSLDSDSKAAGSYDQSRELGDKARSRGNIGGVTAAVGAVALIGAAAWIVTHRKSGESSTVTGWLAPDSGGIGVAGAF